MLWKYDSGVIFSIVQLFCTCSSVLTMSHLCSLWTSFTYIKENWAHNKLKCLLLSLPLFFFRNFKLARVKRIILIFFFIDFWVVAGETSWSLELKVFWRKEILVCFFVFFFFSYLHVYVSVIVIVIQCFSPMKELIVNSLIWMLWR